MDSASLRPMSDAEVKHLLSLRARPLILVQVSDHFSNANSLTDELKETYRICLMEQYEQVETRPNLEYIQMLLESTQLGRVQLAHFLYDCSAISFTCPVIDQPVLLLVLGDETTTSSINVQNIVKANLTFNNGLFNVTTTHPGNDFFTEEQTAETIKDCGNVIKDIIGRHFRSILENRTHSSVGNDIASKLFSFSKKLMKQPVLADPTHESTLKSLYASFIENRNNDFSRLFSMLETMDLSNDHRVYILLLAALSNKLVDRVLENDKRFISSLLSVRKTPVVHLLLLFCLCTSDNLYYFLKMKAGYIKHQSHEKICRITLLCLLYSVTALRRTKSMVMRSIKNYCAANNCSSGIKHQEHLIRSWRIMDFPLGSENLGATIQMPQCSRYDLFSCDTRCILKIYNNSPAEIFVDSIILENEIISEQQTFIPFNTFGYHATIKHSSLSKKELNYVLNLRTGLQLGGLVHLEGFESVNLVESGDGHRNSISNTPDGFQVISKLDGYGGMSIMISNVSCHILSSLSLSFDNYILNPSHVELCPTKSAVFSSIRTNTCRLQVSCKINGIMESFYL